MKTIQWVVTGYLLAMCVSSRSPAGRNAARRKATVDPGLWLFLLGSLLSSFAWNATSLIAFRVLQGLGGGVMIPLMSTLLMQAAGGRNLGRLMAVVSLPMALGRSSAPSSAAHPAAPSLVMDVLDERSALRRRPVDGGAHASRRWPTVARGSTCSAPCSSHPASWCSTACRTCGDGGFGHTDVLVPGRRARRSGRLRRVFDAPPGQCAHRPGPAQAQAARHVVAAALPLWHRPLWRNVHDPPVLPAASRRRVWPACCSSRRAWARSLAAGSRVG